MGLLNFINILKIYFTYLLYLGETAPLFLNISKLIFIKKYVNVYFF